MHTIGSNIISHKHNSVNKCLTPSLGNHHELFCVERAFNKPKLSSQIIQKKMMQKLSLSIEIGCLSSLYFSTFKFNHSVSSLQKQEHLENAHFIRGF